MNIKTTKKIIIAMVFILAFMLLGTINKVEATTKYYQKVIEGSNAILGEGATTNDDRNRSQIY